MVEVNPTTVMSNGTEELPSYPVAPLGVPRYTAFTVWVPKPRCVFNVAVPAGVICAVPSWLISVQSGAEALQKSTWPAVTGSDPAVTVAVKVRREPWGTLDTETPPDVTASSVTVGTGVCANTRIEPIRTKIAKQATASDHNRWEGTAL